MSFNSKLDISKTIVLWQESFVIQIWHFPVFVNKFNFHALIWEFKQIATASPIQFACTSVASSRSVKPDYMSRDVLPQWQLRRVYFASLVIFNGHLGILRMPLCILSFKVNLKVEDCVKVPSHKLVNPYHEITISFSKGVGMGKWAKWNIGVDHEVVWFSSFKFALKV